MPSGRSFSRRRRLSRSARTARIEIRIFVGKERLQKSRGPQGPRGLKFSGNQGSLSALRRGPQGPRGLKYPSGAALPPGCSRGPQGPRGLKFGQDHVHGGRSSRGPQGPRGLKFSQICRFYHERKSRSARTARIEMVYFSAPASRGCGRGPQGPRGLKWIAS